MPDWITSENHHAVIAALIKVRMAAGLTQGELADRLEIGRTVVTKVEIGQRNVSVVELVAWCRAVGVDPAALVKELDDTMR